MKLRSATTQTYWCPAGKVVKDAIKGMTWDAQNMGTQPEYPQFNGDYCVRRDRFCAKCKEIAVKSENEGRQFVIAVLTAGADKDQG
jgi:hypothetical protein